VVPSAALPANTAIVGAWSRAGVLYQRGGLRVEASTEHLDFFTKNLVAPRVELRAALALMRPKAFVKADVTTP
jgi:HK97 family phage major capsid protein